MGTTLLQSVQLFSTGKLLFESFEFSTWLTDQSWTVAHGTPVNSNATSKDGAYCFPMDSSYPAISKAIANIGLCVVYFYDDATQTATAFTPGVLWIGTDGHLYGLGVSNVTSSGFYTLWNNGVLSATAVARTTGWHRFKVSVVGTSAILSIDGTTVLTTGSSVGPMTAIGTLGSINTTGATFGYFDYVQAATGVNVNLLAKNSTQPLVSLWAPAAAPGSADAMLVVSVAVSAIQVDTLDAPFTAYWRGDLNPSGGASGNYTPYLVSDVFPAMWPGDTYNLNVIDFGRRVATLDQGDSVNRIDTQSVSGKNQGIILNNRDMPSFSITDLPNQLRLDLEAWWSWAKLSQSFGLVIDSSSMFYGQLSAASGTNSVTVYTQDGIVRAANLSVGSEVRLRHFDRSYSEKKKVASISGNTITFTKNLERQYSAGDMIVSGFYWPRLITDDKKFKIALTEPRTKRWSFSLSAQENL